jgi:hypothetical protein
VTDYFLYVAPAVHVSKKEKTKGKKEKKKRDKAKEKTKNRVRVQVRFGGRHVLAFGAAHAASLVTHRLCSQLHDVLRSLSSLFILFSTCDQQHCHILAPLFNFALLFELC